MSNYKLKTNKKVDENVVGIYKKIEDKFVETVLEKTNDDK